MSNNYINYTSTNCTKNTKLLTGIRFIEYILMEWNSYFC